MHIVERGHGEPIVVVPGIQGRWEWVRATVDALAERYRVITFSLGDEPAAGLTTPMRSGMDGFADQIETALNTLGISRAPVCGISFGGLVALRFAARSPERVPALVMVSAPGPRWHLSARHDQYARWPLIFGPFFLGEAIGRLAGEMAAVFPSVGERLRFARRYLGTAVTAPGSASRMARRARLIGSHDRFADAALIVCPTLVMHGEPELDHVVNAAGTSEYVTAIRGAEAVTLERTGHLGFATRPHEFARLVSSFLSRTTQGSHDSAA